MKTQGESGKAFRILKIFHIVCLVAVLLFADALYRMPLTDGFSWGIGLSHSLLKILTIIMIHFSNIWFSGRIFYLPSNSKSQKSKSDAFEPQNIPFLQKY